MNSSWSRPRQTDAVSEKPSPGVLTILCALVGLLCLWTGGTRLLAGWTARHWPVAPGNILSARLEETSSAEGSRLTPHLVFEYRVEGERYVSSRITLAQRSIDNNGWAREMIRRFPAGSPVEVHYDPSQPWEASLFVGATPIAWTQPIFGLLLLAAAARIHFRPKQGPNATSE